MYISKIQSRRRLLKSDPARKGQRRRSQVPKARVLARVWGEHETWRSPSRKGGSGYLPRENFRTSVEMILMHFETIFET